LSVDGSTINANLYLGTEAFISSSNVNSNFRMIAGGDSSITNSFVMVKSQGTVASPTIVASGDILGGLVAQGYDGATRRIAAQMTFEVDGTPGSSDMPGRIVFSTTPDGSATSVERLRISQSGNVGIGTTPSARLHAVSTTEQLRLGYDASNYLSFTVGSANAVTIANAVAADININCGTDKTLVLTESVWADIDFPILIRTTGAGIPTLTTFNGNLTMPEWGVNDYNMCESQEFIHEWKEGTACFWHIHLTTNGLDATDRYVKFELEYAYSVNGVWTFPAVFTSADILIPANTANKTQIIMGLTNFTPTGAKIGDHCLARLKRVTLTGTAPSNNPWIPMLQMHIEKDTQGSRQMTSK
jgi:hypothetical protein